jgi:hypothetical protein
MTGVVAALEESQGRQIAAGAYLNPTVIGAAGRGSIRDPRTGVSIAERTITVEQPLEWTGKRWLDNEPPTQDSRVHLPDSKKPSRDTIFPRDADRSAAEPGL